MPPSSWRTSIAGMSCCSVGITSQELVSRRRFERILGQQRQSSTIRASTCTRGGLQCGHLRLQHPLQLATALLHRVFAAAVPTDVQHWPKLLGNAPFAAHLRDFLVCLADSRGGRGGNIAPSRIVHFVDPGDLRLAVGQELSRPLLSHLLGDVGLGPEQLE
ncbi:MAG: hypothetical protein U1E17_12740 [Geminicoccaceae bacterium]